MRDQAPVASPDHGVACAERSDPHGAGPVGCGGGSGARLSPPPPLLPVSVDIGGMDLSAIRAPAVSARAGVIPLEHEQLFGGGGGFAWFDMPGVGGYSTGGPGNRCGR